MKPIDRWKKRLTFLSIALISAYPLIVYFSLKNFSVRHVGFIVALLLVLRFLIARNDRLAAPLLWVAGIGVSINLLAGVTQSAELLKLYPLLMSASVCAIFTQSLFSDQSMIERIARLREPNWSEHASLYTWRVTLVWSVFLFLNCCLSAYTIFWGSLELWTLYNGLIFYILMGTLFAGEFLFRRFYLEKPGRGI